MLKQAGWNTQTIIYNDEQVWVIVADNTMQVSDGQREVNRDKNTHNKGNTKGKAKRQQ